MRLRRRHLATIAAVLTLCVGFALVSTGPSPVWSFLILLALVMAAAGGALAVYLFLRVERMQGDIDRLARSLDGALKDLAAGNERNSLTLGALSETIDRQIGGVLERIDAHPAADADMPEPAVADTRADNVVPLAPGLRKLQQKVGGGERLPEGWAARDLELSLEPIVSVSQGAAVGFEVHAHVFLDDGSERMARRLSAASNPADLAAFELALVKAAAQASRRQLGSDGKGLPLHVAVSGALAGNDAAVGEVADLLALHKGVAAGLVLSAPAELFAGRDDAARRGLARLVDAGAVLACENWPAVADAADRLKAHGVGIVKIAADRLLDRQRSRRKMPTGVDLMDLVQGSGISVVATDVGSDEDAVALLDLSVDLMRGERFSPPRRLKPASPEPPAREHGT